MTSGRTKSPFSKTTKKKDAKGFCRDVRGFFGVYFCNKSQDRQHVTKNKTEWKVSEGVQLYRA